MFNIQDAFVKSPGWRVVSGLTEGVCNFSNCDTQKFYHFRVIAQGEKKEIHGYSFHNFGSHSNTYPCNYLTAAASVGMTKNDVDMFIKRLDKVLEKLKKDQDKTKTDEPVQRNIPIKRIRESNQ